MIIVYEFRIVLSSFRYKFSIDSDEILFNYFKRELKGSSLVKILRLNFKKDGDYWFIIGYGINRQWYEIEIGVNNLREKVILDRVRYELGWIDKKDWNDT